MELLMIMSAATITHITIGYMVIGIFPDILQDMLQQYPSLICSLYSLIGYIFAGICLMFILIFKIYLKIKPLMFLEMSHERICSIVYFMITLLSVTEISFMLIYHGTLCPKQKVLEFKVIYSLDIDLESFKVTFPMSPLNGVVILILELIYLLCSFVNWMKKRKSRIQVQPIPQVMKYYQTTILIYHDKVDSPDSNFHIKIT